MLLYVCGDIQSLHERTEFYF